MCQPNCSTVSTTPVSTTDCGTGERGGRTGGGEQRRRARAAPGAIAAPSVLPITNSGSHLTADEAGAERDDREQQLQERHPDVDVAAGEGLA